jgi:hypothetical protein
VLLIVYIDTKTTVETFKAGELYREEAIVRAQKMKNLVLLQEKNEVIKLEPL